MATPLYTPIQIKTRASGAAGSPASLLTSELAYNQVDGLLYIGSGDDGAGNATSIKTVAGDNFNPARFLPSGGQAGYMLVKSQSNDYAVTWQAIPQPVPYSGGTGVVVTGSVISADLTVLAALASPQLTGTPTAPTPAIGDNSTKLATTAFVAGAVSTKAETNHNHDASAITSGVFDLARIPVLPGNRTVVSSGQIADLTAAQQSDIAEGTIVTTADGRRFVYASGAKDNEASYVVLADVTPEYSAIANKPDFKAVATSGDYNDLINRPGLAAVATSGNYNDLSNRPALGTMASQNANNVNITGGSITGIVLNGGTF